MRLGTWNVMSIYAACILEIVASIFV